MNKILVGTGNPSKFERYKRLLDTFDSIEAISLTEIGKGVLPIIEDGDTAQENATKKALTYSEATNLPTLSVDEALYIDAFPEADQPKTKVRRYKSDRDLTDEEMLERFTSSLKKLNLDETEVRWVFAICLAFPNGDVIFDEVEVKNIMTSTLREPVLKGYPLSSILYDPTTKLSQSQFTKEDWDCYLKPIYYSVKGIIEKSALLFRQEKNKLE